jgi:hypothetical protein
MYNILRMSDGTNGDSREGGGENTIGIKKPILY